MLTRIKLRSGWHYKFKIDYFVLFLNANITDILEVFTQVKDKVMEG